MTSAAAFSRPLASKLARRRFGRLLLVLVPTWALLGVLVLWPLVMLFVGALRTSPLSVNAQWTLHGFARLLDPQIHSAFGVSIVLGITTTAFGIAIATVFAFLSERSDAPFRRLITPAMLIMYATPTLFYAMSFSLLANPYTGIVNHLLAMLPFVHGPVVNVESLAGLIMVTTFRVVAFAYIFIVAGFRAIDSTLDDASLTSGVSRFATLWRIDLPLLAPAMTGAAIIAVIAGLHTFDIAMILAEPAGIRTVATQIYHVLNRSMPPDFASASLVGAVVVLMAFGLGYLQYRLLGGRSFVTVSGKGGNVERFRLGRWRKHAGGLILGYLTLVQFIPLATLIYSTLQPYPGVYGSLTLVHFERVLSAPDTRLALTNTITLAILVGLTGTALAFWISSLSQRLSHTGASALRLAATLPFALPGVVAATAITSAFIIIPGLRQFYGTLFLMGIGLVVVIMPHAVQLAQGAMAQLGAELRQAAQVHGAQPLRSFFDVTVPLVAPQFFFGWYIAAVSVAGNLEVPLLLGGPGLTTVASKVFDLNLQGRAGQAAAFLLILLGLIVGAGLLGWIGLKLAQLARTKPSSRPSSIQVSAP